MPAPALPTFAERLYDRLEPLTFGDPDNNWALAYFCESIGSAFQLIEDLADVGPNGEPGWSVLLDLNRISDSGLPWLAQFLGVQLVPGLTPAQQRYRIQSTDGWNRGTPAALRAVLNPLLTGSKQVIFVERDTDPYFLTVITRNAETPVADWGAYQAVTNSGAETNTTGHTAVAPNTITRDTTLKYSGAASFRYNKVTGAITQYDSLTLTLPAGGVWTVSVRVYIPAAYDGTDVVLNKANFTGATDVDATHASANMALRDQWQQIYRVINVLGSDVTGDFILTSAGATNGKFFYGDEWQVEDNPGVSAYIQTDGATGLRVAGAGPVGKALLSQKPAGIILNYAVTDGFTYLELRATKASYTTTLSGYANYTALRGY